MLSRIVVKYVTHLKRNICSYLHEDTDMKNI
jgi:hypothetical protein